MARVKLHGKEYRIIRIEHAKLGSMAELQYQSGWKLKELNERIAFESYAMAALMFLTLWEAGERPTWDDCLNIASDGTDVEWIKEPSDTDPDDDSEEAAGPTQAPTASDRGAAGEAAKGRAAGRRSPTKTTGSKSKSTSA